MTIAKDHFVLLVSDLLEATRDFETLGFVVSQGNDTRERHNALVVFSDDSYFEIVAYKPWLSLKIWGWVRRRGLLSRSLEREDAFISRLWNHWAPRRREGWIDWCVEVPSVAGFADAARGRGLRIHEMAYGRELADGTPVKWRMGGEAGLRTPFFIEDVTPRVRRLPNRLGRQHPNGVAGVTALRFGVKSLQDAVDGHTRLFGRRPDELGDTEAVYRFADFTLTLEEIGPADAEEGLREVTLTSPRVSLPEKLDTRLSHGARLVITPA
ncbi:MAG: VOC family protein [Sphingomonadales bacterium]|nr:VOC family protein [Sphingomonadales bacterium]